MALLKKKNKVKSKYKPKKENEIKLNSYLIKRKDEFRKNIL